MSHPLLTKVLAATDCQHVPLCETAVVDAIEAIGTMPPDIADALERALDVCARCGQGRPGPTSYSQYDWNHPSDGSLGFPGDAFHPVMHRHDYQPLVTP